MGMREYVNTLAGGEVDRAHVIEEDERTHHLAPVVWQYAADHEPASQVALPGIDQL
jgi:hypothetical protein